MFFYLGKSIIFKGMLLYPPRKESTKLFETSRKSVDFRAFHRMYMHLLFEK